MELATALPKDDNPQTITMLEAVKDNNLLNKPIVHAQTILSQMNTNDCINLKIRLSIFNVPEQNDCHRRN